MDIERSNMELNTRWMVRNDMDAVSELRGCCGMDQGVLEKTVSDPRCICKVADAEGKVMGFLSYKNGKKTIKILEIVVSPEKRRMGVAKSMLLSLASRVSFDMKIVEANIPEDNLPAQMLFKKVGFEAVEIVKSKQPLQYRFELRALKA